MRKPIPKKQVDALVYFDNKMNMYKCKLKGPGRLPNLLSGSYTSSVLAQRAIDNYNYRD